MKWNLLVKNVGRYDCKAVLIRYEKIHKGDEMEFICKECGKVYKIKSKDVWLNIKKLMVIKWNFIFLQISCFMVKTMMCFTLYSSLCMLKKIIKYSIKTYKECGKVYMYVIVRIFF